MNRPLIITFLGTIGILLLVVVLLFQDKRKLEKQLSNLENPPTKTEETGVSDDSQTVVPLPVTPSENFSRNGEGFHERQRMVSNKGAAWRAKRDLDELKELTSLTEGESSSITSALEDAYRKGLPPEERSLLISEILGSDKVREVQTLREEAERFQEQKELEDRIIVLSKTLSLTENQRGEVRKVLASVAAELDSDREAIRSSMKEMMALHFDDEAGRDELQARYDEMKQLSEAYKQKRIALISERLEGTLTKEQLAKLTTLESESIKKW